MKIVDKIAKALAFAMMALAVGAAFAWILTCLAGCSETVYGPQQEEPGSVVEVHYVPGQHGTSTGFSTSGHLVVGDVDVEPVWAVVFECQHGKFVIQGNDDRARQLWQRLHAGQKVTLRYCEKFEVGGGQKKLIGIHFIDAIPQ